MVSLFPRDTWEGPVNGRSVLRKDLAQKVADLEPSFLRFPGGCVTNVGTFDTYLESDSADRHRTYRIERGHWVDRTSLPCPAGVDLLVTGM
jgi:alpha-L-arabinofuranosidase